MPLLPQPLDKKTWKPNPRTYDKREIPGELLNYSTYLSLVTVKLIIKLACKTVTIQT